MHIPAVISLSTRTEIREILEVNVAKVVGPIFIANILNWMFMGTLIMQLYTYYVKFPSDRLGVRILVYTVFTLDAAQTIMTTHHGWWSIVTTWSNPLLFDYVIWSASMIPFMCGLIAGIVQVFYAWRIWMLSPNKFMQAIAVIIVTMLKNPSQQHLLHLHPEVSTWLAASLADDILITACMTYILAKAKSQSFSTRSETMLTALIGRVIQTGAATALCAIVDLALFVLYPTVNYYFVPGYILGKFYTNSLMMTLNLRRPREVIDDSVSAPIHSFAFYPRRSQAVNNFQSVRMDSGSSQDTGGSQSGVHAGHTILRHSEVVVSKAREARIFLFDVSVFQELNFTAERPGWSRDFGRFREDDVEPVVNAASDLGDLPWAVISASPCK
ncbi:hypothetical protein C8J57DRAFT_1466536 [Mycena rebaudengoi]|nr:hypothetical protein C8J57DRAFT_1466536 [Mycena rebaudengoi]